MNNQQYMTLDIRYTLDGDWFVNLPNGGRRPLTDEEAEFAAAEFFAREGDEETAWRNHADRRFR